MKVKMTKRIKHGSNLFEVGEVYTVGAITGHSNGFQKVIVKNTKKNPNPKQKRRKKKNPKLKNNATN